MRLARSGEPAAHQDIRTGDQGPKNHYLKRLGGGAKIFSNHNTGRSHQGAGLVLLAPSDDPNVIEIPILAGRI